MRPPSRSICAASSRASREGSLSAIGFPQENHPFLTLPRSHRPRLKRALDAEARRKEAPHLALGDREGRTGGATPHGKEAREEPAPRLENRRHRPHVFGAAPWIDGTEARVLPDAVERVVEVAVEREDVLLDEFGWDPLVLRERPRLGDR